MRPTPMILVVVAALAIFLNRAQAQQNLPLPEASPGASVSQTVGITDITVSYHRPGVKSRTIWDGLVPFDQVWRAGANENTTITFSGPVKVAGTELPAGTYGVHMIPGRTTWTIILSKNATSWGSYFYNEEEDALRAKVTPLAASFQEWLSYQFNDLTTNSVVLSLRWADLEIPVVISVDVPASVVAHAREVYLRGLAGFGWQGHYQAAQYCALHGVNQQEAIGWVESSIRLNRNFNNLWVKASLLEQTGRADQAVTTKEEALQLATEPAINAMGYQYLGGGKTEQAIELFTVNVERYPDSWNVYDSLGEAYVQAGQTQLAIKNYTKALEKVADQTQKDRIRNVLKGLEAQ